MTVDVEDYFQVSAFEPYIKKSHWDEKEHRVERNTQHILDIFSENNIKATFFTLGWVAERYPDLIKRITNEGHELASHGYEHIRVNTQTPEQFRADIRKTKQILEDTGSVEIKGYRAASFSIGRENLWALDILAEEGHQYSSSIYPVKHDLYGMPEAPRLVYQPIKDSDFKEIPVSTLKLFNKNYPCGGGGFFRLYPYRISEWALKRINRVEQQSAVFYFHPWEIDPEQPKQESLAYKTRFRHYLNLHKMENRVKALLQDFQWDTMQAIFLSSV